MAEAAPKDKTGEIAPELAKAGRIGKWAVRGDAFTHAENRIVDAAYAVARMPPPCPTAGHAAPSDAVEAIRGRLRASRIIPFTCGRAEGFACRNRWPISGLI